MGLSSYRFIFLRVYYSCSRSGRPNAAYRACLLLASCWLPALGIIGAAPVTRPLVYHSEFTLIVYTWLSSAVVARVHWLAFGSPEKLEHLVSSLTNVSEPRWVRPTAWAFLASSTVLWLSIFKRFAPAT